MDEQRDPAELEEFLRRKMQGNPEQERAAYDARLDTADRAAARGDQANLMAGLLSASNKIGSYGGHVQEADTRPLLASAAQAEGQAKGLDDQADQGLMSQRKERMAATESYLKNKREDQKRISAFDEKKKAIQEQRAYDEKRDKEHREWQDGRDEAGRIAADHRQDKGAQYAEDRADAREKAVANRGLSENNQRKETDYQSRFNNINANVDRLSGLIDDVGTVEMFGPESAMMDQAIQDVAVDYAKLVDPDSVARESEVESAKKMLPIRGMGVSNETAKEHLANFKNQMLTRVNSRRQAQGLAPIALPTKAPETDGSTAMAAPKAPLPAGKVRVSNGKETLIIPETRLPDAQKDGYNVVE